MKSHKSIPDRTLEASWKLLGEWEETPNFDLLLTRLRQNDNSEVADMVATLCRSVFRHRAVIDWTIRKLSSKPPRGRIFRVLRIVATQLMYEKQLPPALICDTAVRFCKKKLNKFEASFVNQFLHKLTSGELPKPPADIALNLSPALLKQWRQHFSNEQIGEWAGLLQKPATMTTRLAYKKTFPESCAAFVEKLDLPEWSAAWQVFEVKEAKNFIKNKGDDFYIQDPAPLYSHHLLNPKPGEIIGDMCAAPGGKSLMIAEKLQGEGHLHSCDVSEKRLKVVETNLAAFSTNVTIRQNDALKPSFEKESFDGILLDVPCSNTGVIRRKADVRWSFSAKKLQELTEMQLGMLKANAALIKKGGRLVYSTCSIDPQENEQVVEAFLAANDEFELKESQTLYPCEKHDGAFGALLIRK